METKADRTPKPGEIYRHFKNRLYQVIGVARHSETREKMVVYQALYGDFGLYVRPLEMFISPVDREKYPQAAQEYRFERVSPKANPEASLDGADSETAEDSEAAEYSEAPQTPNPDLIRFLEAEELDEKLAALAQLEKSASPADMRGAAAALEIEPGEGDVREQIENIRKFLKIQAKYDGSRLRDR